MNDVSVTLDRADSESLTYVERLLEANELPAQDVRSTPAVFYIASDGGERIGVGGVEIYGTDGLVRSVVVERSKRGTGYGTTLCDALEAEAAAGDVDTLYLLTTTAAEFFAARGYVEISRERAPTSIQQTTEFNALCPATATCMRKEL